MAIFPLFLVSKLAIPATLQLIRRGGLVSSQAYIFSMASTKLKLIHLIS